MPEVIAEQEQELTQQALTIVERATAVVIKDQASYDSACALLLNDIKPFRAKWDAYWKGSDSAPGPIKLAYRAYKSLLDKFNEIDNPAELAEKTVKAATIKWEQDQERIRQELQRKAQEDAEREAEEERDRAAIVAENAGATEEEVQAIAATPVMAVAAPVAQTFQRAAGMSKPRDNWKCICKDIKRLCAAVAKGIVPPTYVEPNQVALDARARADRQTLNIPGCVPFNDPVASARRR
jgi:multidrug efflux pump subunit AcrA (membrane-fusion protein)